MPATVRWSRSSVCTRRRSSPCRISWANSSESGSGPSPSTGPTSPSPTTHHPALRSVPCSRTSRATSLSKRRRTTPPLPPRVVFGGSSTSRRPACDRCTKMRGPPKSRITYLPRRPVRSRVRPTRDSGGGSKVLSPENPIGWTAARAAPPTRCSSRSASACIWGSSGTFLLGRRRKLRLCGDGRQAAVAAVTVSRCLPSPFRSCALGVRRRALGPRRPIAPVAPGALRACVGVVLGERLLVLLHGALALDEGPEVFLERELPVAGVLEHGHAREVDGQAVGIWVVAAVLHVDDDAPARLAHVPLVRGVHLPERGHDRLDPGPHFLAAVLGSEDVLDVLDVLGEQVRPRVPVLAGRALLPVGPERALDLVDLVVRHGRGAYRGRTQDASEPRRRRGRSRSCMRRRIVWRRSWRLRNVRLSTSAGNPKPAFTASMSTPVCVGSIPISRMMRSPWCCAKYRYTWVISARMSRSGARVAVAPFRKMRFFTNSMGSFTGWSSFRSRNTASRSVSGGKAPMSRSAASWPRTSPPVPVTRSRRNARRFGSSSRPVMPKSSSAVRPSR